MNNNVNGRSILFALSAAIITLLIIACYEDYDVTYYQPAPSNQPLSTVYMAGDHWEYKNITACYWIKNTRYDLPAATNAIDTYAKDITVIDDMIYIAGYYTTTKDTLYVNNYYYDNISTACYWVNGERHDLEIEPGDKSAKAEFIAVEDGIVYIAGSYITGGYTEKHNFSKACYWINGVRYDLSQKDGYSSEVYAITINNGIVYAAGRYSSNPYNSWYIYWWNESTACYWVNGTMYDLELMNNIKNSIANSVIVTDNSIYIGGGYIDSNNISIPCYWANGIKYDLPAINGKNSYVYDITVKDNTIYIAGCYYDEPRYNWTDTKIAQTACYWVNDERHDLWYEYDDSYATAITVGADGSVYAAGKYNYYSEWRTCLWENGRKINYSANRVNSIVIVEP